MQSHAECSRLKVLEQHAAQMRAVPTASERILWSRICARQLGVAFRRQAPVGHFIVDFLAPAARLVVEVDGVSPASRETTSPSYRESPPCNHSSLRCHDGSTGGGAVRSRCGPSVSFRQPGTSKYCRLAGGCGEVKPPSCCFRIASKPLVTSCRWSSRMRARERSRECRMRRTAHNATATPAVAQQIFRRAVIPTVALSLQTTGGPYRRNPHLAPRHRSVLTSGPSAKPRRKRLPCSYGPFAIHLPPEHD
jgi:hypothetical protein